MGTNLRSLVKEYKGKKLEDGKGLSSKGRLTIARIDAIQNFYGRTIRDNKNNPEKMSKEIWAILYHYSSTASEPNHSNCPTGAQSWFPYQRDIATALTQHKPTKWPFTPPIINTISPVFKRLAGITFLEKCKQCTDQNANESFNSMVWSLSPKEQYNSPMETSLALNIAVCIYNSGMEYAMVKLFEKSNLDFKYSMLQQWRMIDKERVQRSDYSVRED